MNILKDACCWDLHSFSCLQLSQQTWLQIYPTFSQQPASSYLAGLDAWHWGITDDRH